MGTFIVVLNDDNQGVFRRIRDFCIEYQVDRALAFIMTPYPGKESFARLKWERRIICEKWEKCDSLHAVYQPL
ncbi:MAG: B12-binding domain-containing radical SAM protein, partial [Thermodesulfobacteriota bacterium]